MGYRDSGKEAGATALALALAWIEGKMRSLSMWGWPTR